MCRWAQRGERSSPWLSGDFAYRTVYAEGRDRAVTDYISGMSDEFAIRTFEDVFVPQSGMCYKRSIGIPKFP